MKVSRTFGSMARGVGLFMLFLLLYPLVTGFILIFILSLSVRRWLPTEGSGDSLDSFLNLCAAALAGFLGVIWTAILSRAAHHTAVKITPRHLLFLPRHFYFRRSQADRRSGTPCPHDMNQCEGCLPNLFVYVLS